MSPPSPRARTRAHRWLLAGVLLLAALTRLYGISDPPWHFLAWRETQTLMLARNYARHGMALFRPTVSWRSTTPRPGTDLRDPEAGIAGGTELPLTSWLTAGLYRVTGETHWAGRLLPVLFSVLGLWWFARLMLRRGPPRQALIATTLLAFSFYSVLCGRLHMPEALAFACLFGTLLYYDRWLTTRAWRDFLATIALGALMLLGKQHLVVAALPMAWMAWRRYGVGGLRRPGLYACALLIGLPAGAWTAYSQLVLLPQNGLSFAQPELLRHHLLADPDHYLRLVRGIWWQGVTPPLVALALAGVWWPRRGRGRGVLLAWLAGAALLFVLTPGGTRVNGYYQLILAAPAAGLAARFLSQFPRNRARVLAAVAAVGVTVAWNVALFARATQPFHSDAWACGTWLRQNFPADALVLTSTPEPVCLYASDRVGWTCWRENYGDVVPFDLRTVERVGRLGATAVAVAGPAFATEADPAYRGMRDVLFDSFAAEVTPRFTVFALSRRPDLVVRAPVRFERLEARRFLRGPWRMQPAGDSWRATSASRAGVRVRVPEGVGALRLTVSGTAPGQRLRITHGGATLARHRLPRPEKPLAVDVPVTPGLTELLLGIQVEPPGPGNAGIVLHGLEPRG